MLPLGSGLGLTGLASSYESLVTGLGAWPSLLPLPVHT